MSNQQRVFDLISALTGQRNILTIPRIFIDLTGSLEAALFLSQLIYWSDKGKRPDGFIYKTRQEWSEETALSPYAIGKATKLFVKMDLLETKKKRANGSPTIHYRMKMGNLADSLNGLLESKETNPVNSEVPSDEIESSNSSNGEILNRNYSETTQETTQETTHKITTPDGAESQNSSTDDDDAAWLAETRIVDIGDEPEEPPTERPTDYLGAVVKHAEEVARGKKDWGRPADAGGADDYADGPVDAFCRLVGLGSGELPDKKRRQWAKPLREVAQEWGAGPADIVAAIEDMLREDSPYAWKTYSAPYQQGFRDDLGATIGTLKTKEAGVGRPKIITIGSWE